MLPQPRALTISASPNSSQFTLPFTPSRNWCVFSGTRVETRDSSCARTRTYRQHLDQVPVLAILRADRADFCHRLCCTAHWHYSTGLPPTTVHLTIGGRPPLASTPLHPPGATRRRRWGRGPCSTRSAGPPRRNPRGRRSCCTQRRPRTWGCFPLFDPARTSARGCRTRRTSRRSVLPTLCTAGGIGVFAEPSA